jgi:hypothetical protein
VVFGERLHSNQRPFECRRDRIPRVHPAGL